MRFLIGVALSLVSVAVAGQDTASSDDEEARLAIAAEQFELRARVLTLFDRRGNVGRTVGERDVYIAPTLSPDGNRIAVIIVDLVAHKNDLWVIDVESGERKRITAHQLQWDSEWVGPAVWSPDGNEIAYVAMRDGYEGIYRTAADGSGEADLLYRHPGANVWLGDWSADGRYLSLSTGDMVDGRLYILPVDGEGEHEITELLQSHATVLAGSFSPDGKWLSYRSEETGDDEIYIWNLETNSVGRQVSEGGGLFVIRGAWAPGSDEFYYLATGEKVIAAKVDRDLEHVSVERKFLFDLSPAIRPGPIHMIADRAGDRFLIAVPHSPQLEQIAVFDREGRVLQRVGEPGVFRNPSLSPDGKKVAVRAWIQETNDWDIWKIDLESGQTTAITDDRDDDNWPIWSSDGDELAYMSLREPFSYIMRTPADGSGEATEVFTYEPGAFLNVSDWSQDGQYISFNDGCWGVLYVVSADGSGDEVAMEWIRDEFLVAEARFSPNGRFIAYLSDEIQPDIFNLYIAPFDPGQPDGRVPGAVPLQASTDDVLGMVSWRENGKELYYLTRDWVVMVVDVRTEPEVAVGEPRKLFELPGPLPGTPRQWKSATPDGQNFVFVLNVPVTIR